MKFDFKLNTDQPGQHMAILALSGVFIFLSFISWLKTPAKFERQQTQPKGLYSETGETLYQNPHLAWYERFFCRGYQRAGFCSYRLLHPFKSVFDSAGIEIQEGPPEKNPKSDYDPEDSEYKLTGSNDPGKGPSSYRGVTRETSSITARGFRGKIVLEKY